jgi:homoserine/homoserine lactone efflux protein
MKLYPLFIFMATMTVLSPGPGVLMTLTNALRYGLRGTFGGILGIATGALVVAAISATSVGVLLAASATAFTVLKFAGAAYLLYLGVRLWRAPPFQFAEKASHEASFARRFGEGLTLQFTNPKAIFFFLSVFPQFIDPAEGFAFQFSVLVLSYSALVVAIHTLYALFAQKARGWFNSPRGGKLMNKAGAVTFVFFGVMMATARR